MIYIKDTDKHMMYQYRETKDRLDDRFACTIPRQDDKLLTSHYFLSRNKLASMTVCEKKKKSNLQGEEVIVAQGIYQSKLAAT